MGKIAPKKKAVRSFPVPYINYGADTTMPDTVSAFPYGLASAALIIVGFTIIDHVTLSKIAFGLSLVFAAIAFAITLVNTSRKNIVRKNVTLAKEYYVSSKLLPWISDLGIKTTKKELLVALNGGEARATYSVKGIPESSGYFVIHNYEMIDAMALNNGEVESTLIEVDFTPTNTTRVMTVDILT